jgi:hypothetical protein
MAQQPPVGQGLLIIEASRLHSDTPHLAYDSSGRVISPTQGPLPDNTKHSQETDIHAARGIQTHNPSKPAAADPRLGPHSHGDRPYIRYNIVKTVKVLGINHFKPSGNFTYHQV